MKVQISFTLCLTMLEILCATLITILLTPAVLTHPARPTLPLCTEENVKGGENKLQCIVYADQFLDFDEIRTFTAARNEKFNTSINCYNGGKIRLPWPFFAKNLVTLHISDCVIEGFLSEKLVPQVYPNELKQVLLSNLKIKVTVKELYDSLLHLTSMSKDFDCGHTNAVVSISRNIEYVFPPLSGSLDEMILMEELMSSLTLKKFLSHNTVCRYEKLRSLEESGSRSFSRFHMKLMESSQYPNLEIYALRNNSLTSVPVELENLRSSFLPKISIIDLSDNNIGGINFKFSRQNKIKLLINLRRNLLRLVSSSQLNEILSTGNVILDVRENPLDCSCELFSYGEYLFSMSESAIARDIYREVTCRYEENGTVSQHFLSDKVLHRALCSKTVV